MNFVQNMPKEMGGGFGLRFVAFLIDQFLITFPSFVIQAVSVMAYGEKWGFFIALAMTSFLGLVYFGFMQAYFEGTAGKKAVGLAVVSEDGERLDVGSCVMRYFTLGFLNVFFGIGAFSILASEKRQGWHDLVARSVVVRRDYLDQYRKRHSQPHISLVPSPESQEDQWAA